MPLSGAHILAGDSLSRYLTWAVNNISSTRRDNSDRYRQFVVLDHAFEVAFQNLSDFGEDSLFAPLLTRSWFSFRGTCMMAMSGQAAEAYVLMRGCLEGALYALHIDINPELRMVWLNRDRDVESRKVCQNRFKHRGVAKSLEAKSQWLYEIMSQLYEQTIDQGAHPNKRSVTDGLEVDEDIENKTLSFRFVVGGPDEISKAWKTASHVGACALHILQLVRPDYFKRLGIDTMIDSVTKEI